MQSSPPLVLGIDGGGTKTVAWLALLEDPSNSAVVGRGTAGPGNPRAIGFDAARANITAAIQAAFADAERPPQPVASACFGLAGAGRAEEQEQIRAWTKREAIASRVVVTGDAEPVLAAATSNNVGIALISGTGSLAWGRNAAGQTARAGGWGYLLGDEGSGYAIALAGLQAAVRAADGRGPATMLLDRMQQGLGAETPQSLVERIYRPEMNRPRLAELSQLVFQAAADGDGRATEIIAHAGSDLADMVVATARSLDLGSGPFPLALTGGVILRQSLLRHYLALSLERAACQPDITLVAEPVRGAIALARQAAG